jgi:hypothetical protein
LNGQRLAGALAAAAVRARNPVGGANRADARILPSQRVPRVLLRRLNEDRLAGAVAAAAARVRAGTSRSLDRRSERR